MQAYWCPMQAYWCPMQAELDSRLWELDVFNTEEFQMQVAPFSIKAYQDQCMLAWWGLLHAGSRCGG